MDWIHLLCVVLFFAIAIGVLLFLWYLEKPERELRKQRMQDAIRFFRSGAYIFEHIACDIVGFDRARAMFEEYCRTGAFYFENEGGDSE